jgi:crotonobetainyl-CoA:carnitine CoA-transferase CaiB-like acyl-CoA transferase
VATFLDGVRVVTFTAGVAGPNAGRALAQAGAEVIKIESLAGGLDSFRYFASDEDVNGSPRFLEANLNVLSAQIDLKTSEGRQLVLELVAHSDVVLDNFRSDVLPRLGLGPEQLHNARPDLVVLKMPGLGSTGPKSTYGTWGSTLTAFSGITYLWNHPDQPLPVGSQGVYPDYLAAIFAPFVIVAALLHRDRTGQGAVLDMSQAETTAYFLGTSYLEASVTGREPEPVGNDWPYAAPQNCYRCAGVDRWCVVSVETDAQWRALCDVLGRRDLAADPLYGTLVGRRQHRDTLDSAVAGWMLLQEAGGAMARLQAAGVPAGVVQSGQDLLEDKHLRERGFIGEVEHPRFGRLPVAGVPMRISNGDIQAPQWTAELGKHNEHVICDILGYSRDQLRAWEKAGVVH